MKNVRLPFFWYARTRGPPWRKSMLIVRKSGMLVVLAGVLLVGGLARAEGRIGE